MSEPSQPWSPPTKAGLLEYDPDERTGRARATTLMCRFDLRVTAERTAEVGSPSEYVVLSQRVVAE